MNRSQKQKSISYNKFIYNINLTLRLIMGTCSTCNSLTSKPNHSQPIRQQNHNPGIFHFQSFTPDQDERRQAQQQEMGKPYCKIGVVIFERVGSKGRSYATGLLIKQNLVVTSAHTFLQPFWQQKKIIWYKPIKFYYQLNGLFALAKFQQVEDYRLNEVYRPVVLQRQGKNFDWRKGLYKDMVPYDYALLKLKNPIEGFVPPKILKNYSFHNKYSNNAVVYGYPFEHMIEDSRQGIIGALMMGQQKQITNTQDSCIKHNIQTSKCQSGSPIFLIKKTPFYTVQYYLVGIHCGRFQGNKYGVLISDSFVDSLTNWQTQMSKDRQSESQFKIYEFNPQSRKIKRLREYREGEEQRSEDKTERQQLVQHLVLNKIKPNDYQEFDLRFAVTEHYEVKEVVLKKRREMKVARVRSGLQQDQSKQCYLVAQNQLPNEGKWFIYLYVQKYHNSTITVGFADRQKQEIDILQCDYLILRKDSRRTYAQGQVFEGAIWSSNKVVKQGSEVCLRQKSLLRIFINMEQQRIYWGFSASSVVQCQISNKKIGLFISITHQGEIVIIRQK